VVGAQVLGARRRESGPARARDNPKEKNSAPMSPRLELTTSRLTLIPVTLELIEAEIGNRTHLSQLLGAEVPADWPPPLNDENSMRWTRDHLAANPDSRGWGTWYFLLRREGAKPVLIGNGGFKGKFVTPGACEVGYSVMENHQGNGYASEVVSALVEWAFTHPEVERVVAHTLPELTASVRVLEKNGFTPAEPLEPDAIMFELKREARANLP
jgi:RimJ/RimL family protein N-acetyltransferase